MNKIEYILENYFKKEYEKEDYKNIVKNNLIILKKAFLAGYEQAVADRKKLEGEFFV